MLRPFLMIGVGGSGGKTLRIVHHELERMLSEIGWAGGFPAGWQFLHIDVPSVADGDDSDLPPQLVNAEYAGLVTAGINYRNIDAALAGTGRTDAGDAIAGWRPAAELVNVSVEKGAGQYRALGRAITLANLKSAKVRLDDSMRNINGREVTAELMELTSLMGGVPSPVVKTPISVVVSSIAGGSGAGAVIDICDLLRASGNGVWPGESIGILYCPDVFDYLDPSKRRGVRPNALATLAELMAGYWNNQGPSKETIGLLNRQGVAVGDVDRLGPRFPFLVGSQNEAVTYRTQNDIYHAMGRSLASWMTSTALQDRIDGYVAGNWAATASNVADNLQLNTGTMETPFSAMGSARVGLGRDRFRDYAAQRLARAAVEHLLLRHEKLRNRGDERPSFVIAQEVADQRFTSFLESSRLNERTEEKNDILDALRPATRDEELRLLGDQIFSQVTGSSPEKGLAVIEWRDRIAQKVREIIDRQLDEFDVANRECGRAWVSSMQEQMRQLAAQTLGMDGFVVTEILFRKLADELRSVRTELEQEAGRYLRAGENIEGEVETALRTAEGDVLPKNHPHVSQAVLRGVAAIHYRSEARLRQLVIGVLPDLIDNLILRLAEEIGQAGQALQTERDVRTGGGSIVSTWPDGDEVPRVLLPAANEFLLESPDRYGATLYDLVQKSVEAPDRDGAFAKVLRQIIMGTPDHELDRQTLVIQPAAWTPRESQLHVELSTPQRASYKIVMAAEDLLARAIDWLHKSGTPAGNFMREGLDKYFDTEQVEPAQVAERLARFEQQFAAAVDAAQPLVGIKKSVLVAVHPKAGDSEPYTYFTELPVAENSEAARIVKRVLESKGRWNAEIEKSFRQSDRDYIDAFALLPEPYEPVVFTSLMKPIAEEWGDRSKSPDGRDEFWRWRRARELPEFIPAAPAVRKAMVRGWFTAAILGQIKFEDLSAQIFVPNSVGSAGDWRSFPSPLLASGIHAAHDYLPLVLESLPLAFVDVSVTAELSAMAPYVRLRDLGSAPPSSKDDIEGLESYSRPARELREWVEKGAVMPGAPTPDPATAGTPDGDLAARKTAVIDRLARLAQSYAELIAAVEKRSELSVPRAYELRGDITACLEELRAAVDSIQPPAEGTAWN